MLSGLLHLGVSAPVDKRDTTAALIDAIRAAMLGGVYLSDRVRNVIGDQRDASATTCQRSQRANGKYFSSIRKVSLCTKSRSVSSAAEKLISTQKRTAMRKLVLETESDLIEYARKIGLV